MKLFGQHIHAPILLLATAEYGLAALAFAFAAMLFVGGGVVPATELDRDVLPWVFAFSTAVVVGLTAVGLYQVRQRLRIQGIVVRLAAALALSVLTLAVVDVSFPARWSGYFWASSFILSLAILGAARFCFGKLVDHNAFRTRVLVYGAGTRASSILSLRRRSDQRGFKLIGFIAAPGDQGTMQDDRLIATPNSLLNFAQANDVEEIVVAMDERRNGFPIKELLECKFAGIAVIDLLTFLERETGRVKVDLVNPAWLIFSERFSRTSKHRFASRVLDLLVASVLAVATLPVMLIVGLAVLLEDGSPVLYSQQRVGLCGKRFVIYKFRSMIHNAESKGSPQWARVADPRVTRVGKVIRKLRLDELPQLFSVIRGDMSLVGPRPERPEFVDTLSQQIPFYQERHTVKPGITGWAQLSYPYGSSEQDAMEKLQYDLYYVKHRSFVFDVMLLLQTVEVVLWGKGAR